MSDFLKDPGLVREEENMPEPVEEKKVVVEDLYQERLRAAKMTEVEARAIVDTVLITGYYEEERTALKGKLRVTFRTRSNTDVTEANHKVEDSHWQLEMNVLDLLRKHYLAASIQRVTLNGKVVEFEEPRKEGVWKWIGTVPSVIYDVLIREQAAFDARVYAAFSEGVVENF